MLTLIKYVGRAPALLIFRQTHVVEVLEANTEGVPPILHFTFPSSAPGVGVAVIQGITTVWSPPFVPFCVVTMEWPPGGMKCVNLFILVL